MAEITSKDEKRDLTPASEAVTASGYERSISLHTADGEEPTEEEMKILRHVGDTIPLRAWLVAVVELAERFTYYGLTGPFQNYMQNKRNDPLRPGALGLGQSKSTALSYFFTFWVYVMPIFGAVVADSWLGRYKTICLFTAIYMSGIFVLFITSLPTNLEHGAGLGGLITAMIIIGIGAGGIKSNVSPLIADQYTERIARVKTTKKGERVIVDPNVTIQTIYNIFYWCINIGSLSAIATTWMELRIDFWAAYLLPFCFFWVAVAVLILGRKQYVERPPEGTILPKAFRAMWIALKNKGNMDAAKPSWQVEKTGSTSVPWGDLFIEELKRGLLACRVFIAYPVAWVCYNQMNNNLVSQAGTMETHGVPNDVINNFNPISIIIFIPILEKFVYPALRKWRIPFKPITRITFGFILVSIAMAYAAGIQALIYKSGPCYKTPLADECSNGGKIPNHVHVMAQVPTYVITGFGEIFFSITGLEYAYTKAPPSMKSVVMSMFLLTNAFGSALGIALAPAAVDPKLVGNYAGLAGGMFAVAVIFYLCFRKYNATEEEMNKLDALDTKFAPRPTADIPIGGHAADRVAEKEGVAEVSV